MSSTGERLTLMARGGTVSGMEEEQIDSYLTYLEYQRFPDDLPSDEAEAARLLHEVQERLMTNPHQAAADDLTELVLTAPDDAWPVVIAILDRCDERDVPILGAGLLQTLLQEHADRVAEHFANQLRSSDRFLRAFQYAAMTGVPLTIQQQLNAVLLERGVDPKLIVEYDDGSET